MSSPAAVSMVRTAPPPTAKNRSAGPWSPDQIKQIVAAVERKRTLRRLIARGLQKATNPRVLRLRKAFTVTRSDHDLALEKANALLRRLSSEPAE